MHKKFILLLILVFSSILFVACGGNEEESNQQLENTNQAQEEEAPEENIEEEEGAVDESVADSHFEDLITYMAEYTNGSASVLYENTDGETHEVEDVTIDLQGYALIKLDDYHDIFATWFDDQTDGGVLLTEYTIKNDGEEDLFYTPNYTMTYEGADKGIHTYNELLAEENKIPNVLADPEEFWLKRGDEVTRYFAYPLGENRLETIEDVGKVDVEITVPQTDPDDTASTIGEATTFTLPVK